MAEFAVEESLPLLLVERVPLGAGEAVDLGEVVGQLAVREPCAVLDGARDVGMVLFFRAHGCRWRPRSHFVFVDLERWKIECYLIWIILIIVILHK